LAGGCSKVDAAFGSQGFDVRTCTLIEQAWTPAGGRSELLGLARGSTLYLLGRIALYLSFEPVRER
jgi:hypothetical protein